MQSQTPLEPLSATSLGAETECEVLSDDPYAIYIPQQLNYSGLPSRTSNEVCGSYYPDIDWTGQISGNPATSVQFNVDWNMPLANYPPASHSVAVQTHHRRQRATTSYVCEIPVETNTGWSQCSKQFRKENRYLRHFGSHLVPSSNSLYLPWLVLDNDEIQEMGDADIVAFVESLRSDMLSAKQWNNFITAVQKAKPTEEAMKIIVTVFRHCVSKDENTRKKKKTTSYRFSTGYYLCNGIHEPFDGN
ncbi:hypothetical protein EJ05DRAFT_481204, partial [Pseudovirgaria hyperparasitica]